MGEYVRSDDKLMKYWTQFPSDWMNLMTSSENLKLLHDKIESKNLKVAKTQTTIQLIDLLEVMKVLFFMIIFHLYFYD